MIKSESIGVLSEKYPLLKSTLPIDKEIVILFWTKEEGVVIKSKASDFPIGYIFVTDLHRSLQLQNFKGKITLENI